MSLPQTDWTRAELEGAVFDRCDGALVLTGWNLSGG
jgi:hypothetical protein